MRTERCRWSKAGPTLWSPPNVASKTIVGLNSLIGGSVTLPSAQKVGHTRFTLVKTQVDSRRERAFEDPYRFGIFEIMPGPIRLALRSFDS